MRSTPNMHKQTADTYRRMACEACYRPAAPSDGWGNITAPLASLDLDQEARDYAVGFLREEEKDTFYLGCPDYGDRPALVFIVEAARLLCGMERDGAAVLLRMALAELTSAEGRAS